MTKLKPGFPAHANPSKIGDKNEVSMIPWLNRQRIYKEEVIRVGGTRTSDDAIAGTRGISLKFKGDVRVGTFDWMNTTSYTELCRGNYIQILEKISHARHNIDVKTRKESKKFLQEEFTEATNNALEFINTYHTQALYDLILDCFYEKMGKDVYITDAKGKIHYRFPMISHPVYNLLYEEYPPILIAKRNAKLSRTIFFEKDNNLVDIGLRLRLGFNNGMSAALGLSGANKNSSICFKLQQDNVIGMLDSINHIKYNH